MELGRRQRSPAEPIFLPLEDFAAQTRAARDEIVAALKLLQEVDFIEGPGAYLDYWLFRKLTQRGEYLIRHIEDEGDWSKLKEIYQVLEDR